MAEAPLRPEQQGVWSEEEHARFLEAMQFYPQGPWKCVAEFVGTRSVRQVQTHAQKYHEKIARRIRGLRKERKQAVRQEHRIDDEMMEICHQYSVEQVGGANIAPPPTLWSAYSRSSYEGRREDQGFQDYREYGYIDYIEEEFAFREVKDNIRGADDLDDDDTMATAAAGTAAGGPELPSFSDCLDYLIDVFGTKELHHASVYRSIHRR